LTYTATGIIGIISAATERQLLDGPPAIGGLAGNPWPAPGPGRAASSPI